jgi:adenosylcobinamide-GDP ribazoletransferase
MTRLRGEFGLVLMAAGFLTRLPLPADPRWTPRRMAMALRWFPAVGLAIGVVAALVFLAAAMVLQPLPALLVSTAAIAVLTGALHEDGLADTLDGLGGATRERALAIMRDGAIGPHGALGLGLVVATQVATLAGMTAWAAVAALVSGHALARLSIVLVVATSRYVRPIGAGSFAAFGISRRGVAVAVGTGVLILAGLALILGPVVALGAAAGMALGHGLARALFERRLGGYTGDCLGATHELSRLGVTLGIVACL